MGPEGALPCSQNPTISPYLEPDKSAHNFPPYFSNIHYIFTLPSIPRSSPQVFRPTYCIYFSALLFVLHDPLASPSLISSSHITLRSSSLSSLPHLVLDLITQQLKVKVQIGTTCAEKYFSM